MNDAVRGVGLIARREFVTRVRSRAFVIGTALIIVGIVGYLAFQVFFMSKLTNTVTLNVAFVGPVSTLAKPFTAAAKTVGYKINEKPAASLAEATTQVQQGKLDAVIAGAVTSPEVLARNQVPGALQAALQSLVRQEALNSALVEAGVNPVAVNAKLAEARVTVTTVKGTDAQRIEVVIAGFVVAILLYIALITYGQFIAQGVVEEKANRIVEILLSTVRPEQLLLGKVLGIGLVALFQLSIIGFVGVVLATVTQVFTVPTVAIGIVLAGILWFVLGFFLYAVLFAAAGSLVSRNEEVQNVVMPITMVAVVAYLASISVVTPMFTGAPMSSTGILLAMIPLISPVLMPTGMATGDIAAWQAVLAVVLTLLTGAGAALLAARIYSNSVLRLGARVKLRDALGGDRRKVA